MQESEPEVWTEKQIVLQQWLALPKRERKPRTMEALARSLDVDPSTLYRWKQSPGFMDAVKEIIHEHLNSDLSDIYGALRREAKGGNFQHIKLVLELVGDYVERREFTGKDGGPIQHADVSKLSDEDLAHIASRGGDGALETT